MSDASAPVPVVHATVAVHPSIFSLLAKLLAIFEGVAPVIASVDPAIAPAIATVEKVAQVGEAVAKSI